MKPSIVLFFLMCFTLAPVAKLSAQGTGELLHADYGTDTNSVDVTLQVASMLHNGNASFRVDSMTLGVDPAVGEKKTFRLVTREANGSIQHLEFAEKQKIMLRGYAFDSSSKGLRILGAEYGVGNQFADVTSKVNALLKNGQLVIKATSDELGADPVPKLPKVLTIWYTFNGQPGQAVVKEKDSVRMPGGN